MSQVAFDDLDAEFAELLGEDANEDTRMPDTTTLTSMECAATTHDPLKPTEGAVSPKVTASTSAATQEHQLTADEDKGASSDADRQGSKAPLSGGVAAVPDGANKKPALAGRKRQLTVPSGTSASAPAVTKRASLKAQAKTTTTPKTTAATPLTEDSKATDPTPTASTYTAAASGVSPLKRHKSCAIFATKSDREATAAVAEGDTAADGQTAAADDDDEDMQQTGEEEEVKSPLKRADKLLAAAPPAPTDKAKPAAARKNALQVAKATGPAATAATTTSTAANNKIAKPPAAKLTKLATATGPSSFTAAAGTAVKLPKPKNAFMIFSDEKRASIKEASPGIGIGDIAKQLGEQWKAMTAEEKQPYADKATADKERCAAEIAAMNPDLVAAIRKAEVDKRAAAKGAKKGAAAAATAEGVEQPARLEKSAAKEAKKEAEKSEKVAEKTAATAAKKAEKAAAKAAAKEEANKKKAAFKCFYTSNYKSFREKSPAASPEEISSEIKCAWDALDQQEQEPFFTRAEEEAEALKAASKPKAKHTSSSASAVKRGQPRKSRAASEHDGGNESDGHDGNEKTGATAEDDDDSDREDVDWEEYPAAAIIAHTTDGASLLVQRRGVGLNEYGAVNARKAKQQLIDNADASDKLPVSAAMLEEYERFKKSFWTAVHRRTCKGSIDMEDLEEGSPLEMCYLLGKLQEDNHMCCPKGKAARNKGTKEEDFLITVPGLKLSMAMQRVVNLVRKDKLLLQQHLLQLLQALGAEHDLSSQTQEAMSVAKAALQQQ